MIELDPTHLDAYRLLDHVLFKQKRLDEIVQHWNRYLALRPKDADALMERSGTYYHKGEMSLAKQDVTDGVRPWQSAGLRNPETLPLALAASVQKLGMRFHD